MKLDKKAAIQATGIGLLISGFAIALFWRIESRWLEVLFNLGTGIAVGVLYGVLSNRNGTDLEVGDTAGGGALCALLPMTLLWAVLNGPIGGIFGVALGLLTGLIGGAIYAMRI